MWEILYIQPIFGFLNRELLFNMLIYTRDNHSYPLQFMHGH